MIFTVEIIWNNIWLILIKFVRGKKIRNIIKAWKEFRNNRFSIYWPLVSSRTIIINNFINQIPLHHYIFKNISKRISIVSKKSILFFFKENLKKRRWYWNEQIKKIKKKKKATESNKSLNSNISENTGHATS